MISIDVQYGGNDTLNGGTGNDILIGGAGNDFLFGNLSEDLLFGDNAAVTMRNGFVTEIQADFNDLITLSLFGGYNAGPGRELGEGEAIGATGDGELPGSVTGGLGALGAGDLAGGLLDDGLFRRLFASSVVTAIGLQGHDFVVLEEGQNLESGEEGRLPQGSGDEQLPQNPGGAGEDLAPPPAATDEQQGDAAPAPAAAPAVRAAAQERDGDLLAAALGFAGLLALQPPKPRRAPPDWRRLTGAADRLLHRLRRGRGSIPRK
jgi:hypothetical protein